MGKGFKYAALSIVILLAVSAGTVWWGYAHLTGLLQGQLRKIAGNDLSIGKVIAHWDRIELEKVVLLRHGNRPFDKRLSVERIELNPRLKSLMSGRLELGVIQIVNPYLLLEIAPDGSLVKPALMTKKADNGAKQDDRPLPVVIDGIVINGGRMEILDWGAGRKKAVGLSNPKERYHRLRFSEIAFELGRLQFPTLDEPTPLRLSLKDEGGGLLTMDGMVSTRGGDCNLKLDLKGLKIIHYRPYFMKEGDLGISSGEASVASNISVVKRQLTTPGTVTLKGLAFDDSGSKGILMGLPAKALINFMADNNGELKVNFSLNGSLDNPRFTVRDSFAHEVASAISRKLGITTPAVVGKGIIGGFGTRVVRGVMNAFGGN
jgi:hypothetical protein